MYYLNIGYAIIQLPEYLLSFFNYLKKKGKNHSVHGNKAGNPFITAQYNKTDLNYAKTVQSTAIVPHNYAPLLHERVNSLELTVKNIERILEEMMNLISLK